MFDLAACEHITAESDLFLFMLVSMAIMVPCLL